MIVAIGRVDRGVFQVLLYKIDRMQVVLFLFLLEYNPCSSSTVYR